MTQSAFGYDGNTPPLLPQDEVLSNILHILWSKTRTSPFLCTSPSSLSGSCPLFCDDFSVFQSGGLKYEESMAPSRTAKPHRYFLQKFFAYFLVVNSHLVESKYEVEASKIFTTNIQNEGGDARGLSAISDDSLWLVGLKLLHLIFFEGGEGFDEKNNDINISISPHELLRKVVDSFHFQDIELDLANLIPSEKQLK